MTVTILVDVTTGAAPSIGQRNAASGGGGTIEPASAPPVLGTAASEGVPPALPALPPEPRPPVPVTPPVLVTPPVPVTPPVLDASPTVVEPPVLVAPPTVVDPPVLVAPPPPESLAPPAQHIGPLGPSSTSADSHAVVAAHKRPASAADASARLGRMAGDAAGKASNAGLGMRPDHIAHRQARPKWSRRHAAFFQEFPANALLNILEEDSGLASVE